MGVGKQSQRERGRERERERERDSLVAEARPELNAAASFIPFRVPRCHRQRALWLTQNDTHPRTTPPPRYSSPPGPNTYGKSYRNLLPHREPSLPPDGNLTLLALSFFDKSSFFLARCVARVFRASCG